MLLGYVQNISRTGVAITICSTVQRSDEMGLHVGEHATIKGRVVCNESEFVRIHLNDQQIAERRVSCLLLCESSL